MQEMNYCCEALGVVCYDSAVQPNLTDMRFRQQSFSALGFGYLLPQNHMEHSVKNAVSRAPP